MSLKRRVPAVLLFPFSLFPCSPVPQFPCFPYFSRSFFNISIPLALSGLSATDFS